MDKVLMKEFGQKMYEDIAAEVVKDNQEYQRLRIKYVQKEREYRKKLSEINMEFVEEYDQVMNLLLEMEQFINMELYVKGAEDRERMLR